MKDYLTPVSDEIVEDNLGGIFGKKRAQNGSKSLMISGHLDEIGFIVTQIDKDGYIYSHLSGLVEPSDVISESNNHY